MWHRGRESSGRFVVVANPGGRRVELFRAAASAAGVAAVEVVAWADVLDGRVTLGAVVREGDFVRLESPGKDFEVARSLLLAGVGEADPDDPTGRAYDRADAARINALSFDKGRILWPRQWYLGFRAALRKIARQLAACPPHYLLNPPNDVAVMFDKCRCAPRLAAAGVAVPPSLGRVGSFDELTARMRDASWGRVFVKLAHGSSGSGVVAYQADGSGGGRHHAVTTVERVRRAHGVQGVQGGKRRPEDSRDGAGLQLYNSRRLRTYTDPREIAALVNALARHRVHVEQWLPKAAIDGKAFDLRVVVVGGRARQVVARLSRSPITNLHLLNERGDAAAVRRRTGEAAWAAAMATCEQAAGCFPASLHVGVDLLFTPDYRRHAVLEVNAFGDLLPGVLCDGQDTYAAELTALGFTSEREPAAAAGVER